MWVKEPHAPAPPGSGEYVHEAPVTPRYVQYQSRRRTELLKLSEMPGQQQGQAQGVVHTRTPSVTPPYPRAFDQCSSDAASLSIQIHGHTPPQEALSAPWGVGPGSPSTPGDMFVLSPYLQVGPYGACAHYPSVPAGAHDGFGYPPQQQFFSPPSSQPPPQRGVWDAGSQRQPPPQAIMRGSVAWPTRQARTPGYEKPLQAQWTRRSATPTFESPPDLSLAHPHQHPAGVGGQWHAQRQQRPSWQWRSHEPQPPTPLPAAAQQQQQQQQQQTTATTQTSVPEEVVSSEARELATQTSPALAAEVVGAGGGGGSAPQVVASTPSTSLACNTSATLTQIGHGSSTGTLQRSESAQESEFHMSHTTESPRAMRSSSTDDVPPQGVSPRSATPGTVAARLPSLPRGGSGSARGLPHNRSSSTANGGSAGDLRALTSSFAAINRMPPKEQNASTGTHIGSTTGGLESEADLSVSMMTEAAQLEQMLSGSPGASTTQRMHSGSVRAAGTPAARDLLRGSAGPRRRQSTGNPTAASQSTAMTVSTTLSSSTTSVRPPAPMPARSDLAASTSVSGGNVDLSSVVPTPPAGVLFPAHEKASATGAFAGDGSASPSSSRQGPRAHRVHTPSSAEGGDSDGPLPHAKDEKSMSWSDLMQTADCPAYASSDFAARIVATDEEDARAAVIRAADALWEAMGFESTELHRRAEMVSLETDMRAHIHACGELLGLPLAGDGGVVAPPAPTPSPPPGGPAAVSVDSISDPCEAPPPAAVRKRNSKLQHRAARALCVEPHILVGPPPSQSLSHNSSGMSASVTDESHATSSTGGGGGGGAVVAPLPPNRRSSARRPSSLRGGCGASSEASASPPPTPPPQQPESTGCHVRKELLMRHVEVPTPKAHNMASSGQGSGRRSSKLLNISLPAGPVGGDGPPQRAIPIPSDHDDLAVPFAGAADRQRGSDTARSPEASEPTDSDRGSHTSAVRTPVPVRLLDDGRPSITWNSTQANMASWSPRLPRSGVASPEPPLPLLCGGAGGAADGGSDSPAPPGHVSPMCDIVLNPQLASQMSWSVNVRTPQSRRQLCSGVRRPPLPHATMSPRASHSLTPPPSHPDRAGSGGIGRERGGDASLTTTASSAAGASAQNIPVLEASHQFSDVVLQVLQRVQQADDLQSMTVVGTPASHHSTISFEPLHEDTQLKLRTKSARWVGQRLSCVGGDGTEQLFLPVNDNVWVLNARGELESDIVEQVGVANGVIVKQVSRAAMHLERTTFEIATPSPETLRERASIDVGEDVDVDSEGDSGSGEGMLTREAVLTPDTLGKERQVVEKKPDSMHREKACMRVTAKPYCAQGVRGRSARPVNLEADRHWYEEGSAVPSGVLLEIEILDTSLVDASTIDFRQGLEIDGTVVTLCDVFSMDLGVLLEDKVKLATFEPVTQTIILDLAIAGVPCHTETPFMSVVEEALPARDVDPLCLEANMEFHRGSVGSFWAGGSQQTATDLLQLQKSGTLMSMAETENTVHGYMGQARQLSEGTTSAHLGVVNGSSCMAASVCSSSRPGSTGGPARPHSAHSATGLSRANYPSVVSLFGGEARVMRHASERSVPHTPITPPSNRRVAHSAATLLGPR